MMEVKIQCACGAKYKFDVEPINGLMPGPIQCPVCHADGTAAANQILGQKLSVGAATGAAGSVAPVASRSLRVASPTGDTVRVSAPTPASAARQATSGPQSLLERTTFFVKERVAMLKLVDAYDIFDPATGQQIGVAKEEPPVWAKWLRLAVNKRLLPTAVNVYEREGQSPVLSIHRGFTVLRSKVRVVAARQELGYFKSKLLSLGGGFNVFDNRDQQVAEVKGNWKGWDFRFVGKNGREIGTVTKKWAGLGKELFTSADNYIISLTDLRDTNPAATA